MKTRCFRIVLVAALVTAVSDTTSHAATRARFPAETVLSDASVRIAAGWYHTCQVNEDGTVRCWGRNFQGQLGNGTTTGSQKPVLVSGLTNAVAVTAGGLHTCALLANGTVRCWGFNLGGQLGDGTTTTRLTPVAVSGLSSAVGIAAGDHHTCVVLADGTVRCWSNNFFGQLGDGTTVDRLTPVAVIGLSNAVAIAGGTRYTCALLAGGSAKCWGRNNKGQLGDGTTTNRSSQVAVLGLGNAVAIAAGFDHTCALLADSTARCWGGNDHGQLGGGTTTSWLTPVTVSGLSNAVAMIAKSAYTCALLADSTARCWGRNGSGQLGDGTTTSRLTPVVVGLPGNSLINAVGITGAIEHTCVLLADGSAKCWGSNGDGQLGNEVYPISSAPVPVAGGGGSFTARDVAAGRNHTCAVRANGTVACWGNNDSGQIGDGAIGGNRLSPVAVPGLTNVVAIAAGDAHTCALLADGTARCWGANNSAQLGNGTTASSPTPVTVSSLTNAVAIAAGGDLGSSHTCALLANGTARCWGSNSSGQIGDGTTVALQLSPVQVNGLTNAVAIAVGEFHTCAIVAVGVPFCWGANGSGQLGNGTTQNRLTPALVSVDRAVAIAAGNSHTCALTANGAARCWGRNVLGQLGNGTTQNQLTPTLVSVNNVVAVAGGFGHSCAVVVPTGGLFCWGDNSSGQLGNGTTTSSLSPTPVVKVFSAITLGGGSTTVRIAFTNAVTVTTGRRHSCGLFAQGAVYCWGENTFGQIGNGTTANQLQPAAVPSFTLNIDPTVSLKSNERVTTVTVVATCEAGQSLFFDVRLTQGGTAGGGNGSGKCTGALERYPVTVPAHGPNGLREGPAQVSAVALIRDGSAVETQGWTRQVNIVREP